MELMQCELADKELQFLLELIVIGFLKVEAYVRWNNGEASSQAWRRLRCSERCIFFMEQWRSEYTGVACMDTLASLR
jgi:hypothetical protein